MMYSPAPPQGAAPASAAPQPSEEEQSIDLRGLALTLWRGRWIILICIVFAGTFGYLSTSQVPPTYRASAKVMFDTQRANVNAGQEVVGSAIGRAGQLATQIEILRSTSLIRRVVEDLELHNTPEFNPALRPREETWRDNVTLPPEIESLLIQVGLWPAPSAPVSQTESQQAAAEERLKQRITRALINRLELRPVDQSLVLEIAFTSGNRRLSAAIVNAVAEQYIVDQLEGKLETFQSATQWLTERVSELQLRVETAEQAVLDAQAELTEQTGVTLNATREQLAALTVARATAREEATTLRARYARLRDALEREVSVTNIPELRDTPAVAELITRLNELDEADLRLAETLRPEHPTRQRLLQERAFAADALQQEATRTLERIRLDLEVAEAREIQLAQEMRSLEDQALELSTESIEINNLERKAQASRILYENLLARLQETNAQEDLQTADARILSPAEIPGGPVGTAKQRTFQVALVLGAALGIGIVFLLERLNNTFRSPGQLEEMTGQPVLSTIPSLGGKQKRNDILVNFREKPNSSMAESIRNLRTSILFSNVDHPPQVVMFSSSVPREGKSTTSTLAALASRQMGKTSIIVDCDLRMPALTKVMKAGDDSPGLLSVINESATLEEAIHRDEESGLHVLMTRPSERTAKINAADILSSKKFHDLVEELKKTYDLVVLDTPPTLVVTDARIVSALADAVVFAVQWDKTPRSAVLEGIKELVSVRAKLIGLVMTQVNEQRASKYAYDGYSYYRGRYRDYYDA